MRETFWKAFDDAEEAGLNTVIMIASILYQRWRDEICELTDFVMVVNHKSWEHHRKGNSALQELYTDLYYEYYEKAINYLESKGRNEELSYFIRTLD